MSTSDTKRELLDHLDKATREMALSSVQDFSTARIAADINVSRNLASQYLNELVREGLAVKVNSHPVLYFHKRGLERYLQAKLGEAEYPSMAALLGSVDMMPQHDFEKAIGSTLSLSSCIAQLKSAVEYPPVGLPVLLVGETGTGKSMLARLTYEFGIARKVLPSAARFVRVDCSRYGEDEQALRGDLPNLVESAAGGVLFFDDIAQLTAGGRDALVGLASRMGAADRAKRDTAAPLRLLFSASASAGDPRIRQFARAIPVVVALPALEDRTAEERTALVQHFLRVEGRRVSADVSISRGALRALVNASFEDNIDGLRTCIINCCAGAYLSDDEDRLVIRAYNLPASVLAPSSLKDDDDQLVSCDKSPASQRSTPRSQQYFEGISAVWGSLRAGRISFGEFLSEATSRVRSYQDYLNFENAGGDVRAVSYEQVLVPIFDEVGTAHDVDLSRMSARLFALALTGQLWGGDALPSWRAEHDAEFQELLSTLSLHLRQTATVVDQIVAATRTALGVDPDALAKTLLFLDLNSAVSASRGRDHVGIILCHGYSTATSIADAANRILRAHIYDAIDMTYDQQVSDVIAPLRRLVERYAYCSQVTLLVDMGSLTDAVDALSGVTGADLIVVSNVSTGLALEVGAAIKANENVEEQLEAMAASCAPGFRVVRGGRNADAIVFCSESGVAAAEKIRQLFAESLPPEVADRLVVADYRDLAKNGADAPVFARYAVRAIVGTMDPGIEGVPFAAFEDILFSGTTERLDKVLVRWIGEDGLAMFHESVVKRLTLQNVFESLTILNPEKLFSEVERAVATLQDLTGREIAPAATIGLYVHLCCLVERLVTKTAVDAYTGEEDFVRGNAAFIEAFRTSFSKISTHYRVEVPTSEIAYVHDYIHSKRATREHAPELASLADE